MQKNAKYVAACLGVLFSVGLASALWKSQPDIILVEPALAADLQDVPESLRRHQCRARALSLNDGIDHQCRPVNDHGIRK